MAVDCHIHMLFDGSDWKQAIARHSAAPDIPWIAERLAGYRERGVTYLRDGGDRWGVGAAARRLAPEYGITYRTPLAPLAMEGHYGGFIGLTYGDLREYARLVREQKAQGADFVKIMVSGLMDFHRFGVLSQPGLDRTTIWELIRIAHGEGMAVMVHANGAEQIAIAAAAGAESIEHGAYAGEAALSVMAEIGTVWVPTLSTIANLRGKGRYPDAVTGRILENTMENVAAFVKMGGLIAPGSDAGAWAVPHDADTEYALLARCGLTEGDIKKGEKAIMERF